MPIGLSAFNGAAPAGLLQMYAELVKLMALEEVRPSAWGATIVRREPAAGVGAIAPWNYLRSQFISLPARGHRAPLALAGRLVRCAWGVGLAVSFSLRPG